MTFIGLILALNKEQTEEINKIKLKPKIKLNKIQKKWVLRIIRKKN